MAPDTHDPMLRAGAAPAPGPGARFVEVSRPPGHYAQAGEPGIRLIQPMQAGIRGAKRWGDARFDGTVPRDSLWLVPPGIASEAQFFTPHRLRVLRFDPGFVIQAMAEEERRFDTEALARAPFFSPLASHLCAALWHANLAEPSERLRTDGALLLLLDEMARCAGNPPRARRGGLAPWQVRRATEAIGAAPERPLSLAELAAMVRLSPSHFAHAFRESLGVAPHRYQQALRMQRAAALLVEGVAVTEVALSVGYASSQALSRAFRQEMGMSPLAYRRQAAG